MSWESTARYYQLINQEVATRLGGLHSARLVLWSADFEDIADLQANNDWDGAASVLGKAGANLAQAGANFLIICTNTMHCVAEEIERISGLPVLHIADATAQVAKVQGFRTLGIMGTRFTMENGFYRDRLENRHGLKVLIPNNEDRALIHRVIYDELCHGILRDSSRSEFKRIARSMREQDAEAVVEACTEIGMLLKSADTPVPLLETTWIHAMAAVDEALKA